MTSTALSAIPVSFLARGNLWMISWLGLILSGLEELELRQERLSGRQED
jgi:hypothetical protein